MNTSEAKAFLDDIKLRCDGAKIEYTDRSSLDETIDIELIISFPCGRETRQIYIWDEDDLEALANIEFESYTFLGNFAAIVNYRKGKIEAILTAPNEPKNPIFRQGTLKRLGLSDKDLSRTAIRLTTGEAVSPNISISPTSKIAKALTQAPDQLALSLTISSAGPTTYDAALALLEKVSNSVLFSIDIERATHIALKRKAQPRRRTRAPGAATDLEYPKNEYDKSPMALYWYARTAEGMPLLQFLAFYQVIEYYYPAYFSAELGRRIRSIIKQPSFRVDRDLDVAKIVGALKSRGQVNASEREQLKATLKECLSNREVEEYLSSDPDRAKFFQSKAKGITSCLINPQNRQIELPMQVADRVYDIRCKIVHTKGDHEEGEIELLLPYSDEAEQLGYDIDLIKFVAQKVLIVSSKSLNIAA